MVMVMRKQTAGTKGRAATAKTAGKTTKASAARAATAKPKPQTKRATATARAGAGSGRAGATKTTARAKSARPQTKPARAAEESAIRNNRTQYQILEAAASRTSLGDGPMPVTVAASLMRNVANECIRHLRPRGSGKCTVPEFNVILERKTKPATKAHPGYNPSTREKITIPAKPARTVVRARAGKRLLDSIGVAAS